MNFWGKILEMDPTIFYYYSWMAVSIGGFKQTGCFVLWMQCEFSKDPVYIEVQKKSILVLQDRVKQFFLNTFYISDGIC